MKRGGWAATYVKERGAVSFYYNCGRVKESRRGQGACTKYERRHEQESRLRAVCVRAHQTERVQQPREKGGGGGDSQDIDRTPSDTSRAPLSCQLEPTDNSRLSFLFTLTVSLCDPFNTLLCFFLCSLHTYLPIHKNFDFVQLL